MRKMIGIVGEGPTDYMVIKDCSRSLIWRDGLETGGRECGSGVKQIPAYWMKFCMKSHRRLICWLFEWMGMFPGKKEKFTVCVGQ